MLCQRFRQIKSKIILALLGTVFCHHHHFTVSFPVRILKYVTDSKIHLADNLSAEKSKHNAQLGVLLHALTEVVTIQVRQHIYTHMSQQTIMVLHYRSYTVQNHCLLNLSMQQLSQCSLPQHQGIVHLSILILHKLKHKCSSIHSEP